MLLNKKKCHAAALLGTTGQHALIPKRQLHPTLTPFCRGSRHQLNLQSTNNPSPATKQDNRGELNQPSPSSQQQPGESALVPSGPSKPSGEGSAEPNQPDGGPGWWLRNRLQGPINWAAGLSEGKGVRNPNFLRLIRLAIISITFVLVAMSREVFVSRNRLTTKEVLYSQFVTLLDSNRVKAARLESGTGRMYFELYPKEQPAPASSSSSSSPSTSLTTSSGAPAAAAASQSTAAAAQEGVQTSRAAASSTSSSSSNSLPQAAEASTSASSAAAGAASSSTSSAPARFKKQYVVKLADKNDYLLASKVLASGVEFGVLKQSFTSAIANVFLTALSLWIPLTPLFFLMRRILDDRSGTKKKRSDSKAQAVSTTFRDVAGVDSAKEELLEVVDVMKKAKSSYTKLKVKMPSGVLLCGPPGTGKTLLAKAVAGEAGIPFLAVSASEFVELFVGRGAARIRELFAEARKSTPCVIFIDELDAVGAKRGLGYNDERDQTLNQLLTELDGFEGRQGVLFLAATNRIDVLDPALLRPGRINRKVVVPLPDERGRQDILNVHLRGVPMASVEEKSEAALRLARVTAGFSGAELANVVNESALLAARKDQDNVTLRECLEGVRRTKFGVNGQSNNPIAKKVQDWMMDIATGPIDKKVGNIAA
mmetsp:Transcript_4482/g.12213  ORF Transcript_4482/g.12213 Transcript_4482/m.12213 type:complete len:653 (-) Transcript_4482:463-2421(-)